MLVASEPKHEPSIKIEESFDRLMLTEGGYLVLASKNTRGGKVSNRFNGRVSKSDDNDRNFRPVH